MAGGLVLLLRPLGGLPLFLAVFSFFDNLLVFTIGALLPLGFTDGSTILTWWDQRQGNRRVASKKVGNFMNETTTRFPILS